MSQRARTFELSNRRLYDSILGARKLSELARMRRKTMAKLLRERARLRELVLRIR